MPEKVYNEAIPLIVKDLSLETGSLPATVSGLDELKRRLVPIINYLLDSDFSRLLNALYRIDVDEPKAKRILATGLPGLVADNLTDIIIERELQKVELRKKYRPE